MEEQRLRQQQPQVGGGEQGQQEEEGEDGGAMEVDHPMPGAAAATPAVRPPTPTNQPPSNFAEMTEEEQMAYALRLSLQEGQHGWWIVNRIKINFDF